MTQTARPASDVSTGSWGTAPLYSKVNDQSDATTIKATGGTYAELTLGSLSDPQSSSNHTIYVRGYYERFKSELTPFGYFSLYQGTTAIATNKGCLFDLTTTTRSYTLTSGEADSITDYTNLRVRIWGMYCNGTGDDIVATEVWMEVPDAGVIVTPSTCAAVTSVPSSSFNITGASLPSTVGVGVSTSGSQASAGATKSIDVVSTTCSITNPTVDIQWIATPSTYSATTSITPPVPSTGQMSGTFILRDTLDPFGGSYVRDTISDYLRNPITILAITQAESTETAQAIGYIKSWTKVVVTATESDSTITFVKRITKAILTASEVDGLLTIWEKKSKVATTVTETDISQALTEKKSKSISTVTETDSAQAITKSKTKVSSTVSSVETAQPIAEKKTKAITTASEVDGPITIVKKKTKAISYPTSTETSQTFTKLHTKSIGTVTSTETPQILTKKKTRAITIATESDGLFSFAKSKRKTATTSSSTDSSQQIRPAKGETILAEETDSSITIGKKKQRWAAFVTEQDSTVLINLVKGINTVIEIDGAIAFFKKIKKSINTTSETDSPQTFNRSKVKSLFTSSSNEASLALSKSKFKVSNTVMESEVGQALLKSKVGGLITVIESDTSEVVRANSVYVLSFALEYETAAILMEFGAPLNLIATPISNHQIQLNWNAVTGALGYDIERDGEVIVWEYPTNSYLDENLDELTTYSYRVRTVVAVI